MQNTLKTCLSVLAVSFALSAGHVSAGEAAPASGATAATTTERASVVPTLQEVMTAMTAGKYDEANEMLTKVLVEHPNSAQAHYLKSVAEALGSGKKDSKVLADAKLQLEQAEKLAPGLPFASPKDVQALKQAYSAAESSGLASTANIMGGIFAAMSTIGMTLGFLFFGIRALRRRRQQGYDSESTHQPLDD